MKTQYSWILLAWTACASAQPVVTNGGFESGLAGWTRADQFGSDGTTFVQIGTTSPSSGAGVPAPPGGLQAAMTDGQGPGSHVLYQDFVVPTTPLVSPRLRFDVFVGNRANAFFTPGTLDFSTTLLNQQARVDFLRAGADPFSVAAADVLFNAYQTTIGDPLVSGYTAVSVDVTALFAANLGNTLRLRFAETDNVFTFQFGVDNVSIAPIPEPSTLALGGLGALIGFARKLRARRVRIRGMGD